MPSLPALALSSLLTIATGTLQPQPLTPQQANQINQINPPVERKRPTISVEFPGGTVAQYVAALKKNSGDSPVNFVVSERASKQPLSAVSLKDVQISVAAMCIAAASNSGTGEGWIIELVRAPGQMEQYADPAATFRIDYSPLARRGVDTEVEAYSVRRLLMAGPNGKASPEVVLTAIETGLKLHNDGVDQLPELKFHTDSGMLFVRGTKSDIRLVGSIISRMTDDAERTSSEAERRSRAEKARALAIKEAKITLDLRRLELETMERSVGDLKKLVDAGTESTAELAKANLALARAKMALERAAIDVERAELSGPDKQDSASPADQEPKASREDLIRQNAELLKRISELEAATTPNAPRRPNAPR